MVEPHCVDDQDPDAWGEYIDWLVSQTPPITDEEREQLRLLLAVPHRARGDGGRADAQ